MSGEQEEKMSKIACERWITRERVLLWGDLVNASHRAQKAPDPLDSEHWSIEMLNITDRIREATELLGKRTEWGEVTWSAWPYYPIIEGAPLQAAAWEWLEGQVERQADPYRRFPTSAEWALTFRPKVAAVDG